jgi:hypothetical protein
MLAKRERPRTAPTWHRDAGVEAPIADILGRVKVRFRVDTVLEVFSRSYASRNPEADIESEKTLSLVHEDIERFYEGGPVPDYVLSVYKSLR